MNPKRIGPQKELEAVIQERIVKKLMSLGWLVMQTHGNMYQQGFPDLYIAHSTYGTKWVEVKRPEGYKFTPAQLEWFPKLSAARVGIWILTDDCDSEINKLFKPANWQWYLKF